MNAAAIILMLLPKQSEEKDGLPVVMGILAGTLAAILILFSAIAYVLTSPIEFLGVLGDFQLAHADQFGEYSPDGADALDDADIDQLIDGISDPQRQAVIKEALSLVGRVSYFWGGKSGPGWNDEWGTLKTVTAAGVSSTGKLRPYGMDCSGYTAWAFETAGVTDALTKGGTAWQWGATSPINEDDLQPGDLAFKQSPSKGGINHVGIFYGKDDDGRSLWLHCSAGDGGVVLNSYSGFRYFRRLPAL